MPVTNLANRTLEPRHAQARNVEYSAAHPSDGAKSTVGSRGPPFVIARQSCGSRSIAEPVVRETTIQSNKESMKYLKRFFQAVTTKKAPFQICTFDAKAGWSKANSPLPALSGSQAASQEDLLDELKNTYQPFWGSCECCADEGLTLYRPLDTTRKEWLAYIKGRSAHELVLLSDFASAMEFMRLYAPGLISIPDHHRVPGLLEEMLECLSNLEAGPCPDVTQ
jgi:hypothetical protein